MKKILFIISFAIFLGHQIHAQNNEINSVFESANEAYGNQDFLLAIDLYSQIINSGYKSAELFMNIGNAYFKIGQYPRAILSYEKAKLLSPNDEDIAFNLQKANAYTIDKIEMIPEFFLVEWMRNFISMFNSNTWAIIALIAFFLALGLLFMFFIFISRSKKMLAFTLGSTLLVIAVFAFSFSIKTRAYIENSDQAIVLSSTVTVKGAPDSDGVNVFIIHEGTKVVLLRSIGDWHEIKLADGKQGWLMGSDIEKI